MKIKIFIFAIILLLIPVFIWKISAKQAATNTKTLPTFTVALDWTPNTNHTGMYVALQKGWYKEQGLNVKILPYTENASPDLLVSTGKADAGIGATENVVADAAGGNPVVSIATILAHDLYGLIALKDNGIKSPRDLDGKIYGGFGAAYEEPVISKIIKKDGGKGEFKNVTLSVGAMQALESKKIDFVWVSEGWEALDAKRKGLNTIFFPMIDYGIADYYTPVIITSPMEIKQKKELLKKFMKATKQGYEYSIKNPKEAAKILIDSNPKGTFPDTELVMQSQEFLSKKYADSGKPWGLQDKKAWHDYPQFMLDAGAITDKDGRKVSKLDFDSLYTNEFLQK